jgi:mannose-6-phosphate isomerase-like protein (cupin superfamily)
MIPTSMAGHDNQSVTSTVPPVGRLSQVKLEAPDGSEIRLLVGEVERATAASLCVATIGPHQASRPVWHRNVEEVWYFLEGEGEVWRCPPGGKADSVEPVAVKAGDALVIPALWYFQFRSTGAGSLRFLCYTSPPWPGPDEAQTAPHGGPWPSTF